MLSIAKVRRGGERYYLDAVAGGAEDHRRPGQEPDGAWLGYLQDFPDYWTQGETLDDLKEHLCDLYADMTTGSGMKWR